MAEKELNRLERLMEKRGYMTQAALAEAAGISRASVSFLVSGRNEAPRPETVARLAQALRVPKAWFHAERHTDYIVQLVVERLEEFRRLSLPEKVAFILDELEATWSEEFNITNVAEDAGMNVDTVRQMLSGKVDISDYFLDFICRKTGMPIELLDYRPISKEGKLPPAYLRIAETAYLLQADPEVAHEHLLIAHKMFGDSERRGN